MTPALQRAAAALEAPFAIGALAVVVFAIWIAKDARYAPATWYTGGVFLAALAIVVFVTYDRVSVSRPAMAALVCSARSPDGARFRSPAAQIAASRGMARTAPSCTSSFTPSSSWCRGDAGRSPCCSLRFRSPRSASGSWTSPGRLVTRKISS